MLWTGGPQSITAAAMGLDNVLPPEAFFSFPGANDTNQGPFDMLTMPLNPAMQNSTQFNVPGEGLAAPSFDAHDIHRSNSQPASKRATSSSDWGTQTSRDTLYAHELLRSFRARHPDSAEGQAACDYCRKRKIKCDRKKPSCGHCAQSGRICTSNDVLRKRGPPSKKERAMMNNAGIVFRSKQSFSKGRKEAQTQSSGAAAQSLPDNTQQSAGIAMATVSQPDIQVSPPDIQAAQPEETPQVPLMGPSISQVLHSSNTGSGGISPTTAPPDTLDGTQDWSALGMPGIQPVPAPVGPTAVSPVQPWSNGANISPHADTLLNRNVPIVTRMQSQLEGTADAEDSGRVAGHSDSEPHEWISLSHAVREALAALYEQHFLPAGMIIPESVCIRILDRHGAISFCPANRYTKAAWNESYINRIIEFPGHRTLSQRQVEDIAHDHHSLFLPGVFQDDDYSKLLLDARRILRHDAVPALLNRALIHVSCVYPVFQSSIINDWISHATGTDANLGNTLTQRRHRKALLLLICAIGTCIGEEVQLEINGDSVSCRAWEFGDQCYRIARGLLTPKEQFSNGDELSIEFVQAVLLMKLYLLVCDTDQFSMLLSLHLSMAAGSRLYSEKNATMEPTQRELLKRTLWAAFTLAIEGQLEHPNEQAWRFPVRAPEDLEAPAPICGTGGNDLAPQVLHTLLSDIRLHAYVAQLLDLQLCDSTVSAGGVNANLAHAATLRDNMLTWARDAELLRQNMIHSPYEGMTAPLAGKTRKVYDVGAGMLVKYLNTTAKSNS